MAQVYGDFFWPAWWTWRALFQKQALSTDANLVQRVIKGNAPFVKPAENGFLLIADTLGTGTLGTSTLGINTTYGASYGINLHGFNQQKNDQKSAL